MTINPFLLERYFADYEFKVKYLLSSSDCESLSMAEVLQMASPDSLKLWNDLKLGYTESQGHPRLREEISKLYNHISSGTVLTAAPEELIFIAMHAMLKAEDHVIALTPGYQSLSEIAHSIGCPVTHWDLKDGAKGWELDLDELERCLMPQTRMIVINFPHNPSGFLPTRVELDRIIEMARKHGVWIFSDEMYRMLEPEAGQRLPAVCDIYEKGISLSGLSKAYSLPGLRLGWLATQEAPLINRWTEIHDYTTICSSAPGEILGIVALQNKEKILLANLEIIAANTATLEYFFSERPDLFAWHRPLAGSVAFPEWKGESQVEDFCQVVLERQGVMVVPGSLFGSKGNHFRVGLGRRNFPEALEHVGAYLKNK